jgi:histidine triad (HIT) family protein
LGGGGDHHSEQPVAGEVTEGPLYAEGCPFCDIARLRDQSVEIVCDTPDWLAFFPDTPATPGHTLIIPRRHSADFWTGTSDAARASGLGAFVVGRALRSVLGPDGINLISSAGSAAEQSVFHAHLHVVPRWFDDRIGPIWPPKIPSNEILERRLADQIRAACSQLLMGPGDTEGPIGGH